MRIRQMASRAVVALALLYMPVPGAAQEESNLSLQTTIALAQQNNPKLMALRREIAAAKGRAWTTWWFADPNLSLEWEGVPTGAGLNQFAERKLTLTQEIESAYAAFRAAQRQTESYTTNLLAQAGEVYRIALRSYEHGEAGYLQLLEAQRTLIEVRQGYIEALANYYAAVAALEKASGVTIIR